MEEILIRLIQLLKIICYLILL